MGDQGNRQTPVKLLGSRLCPQGMGTLAGMGQGVWTGTHAMIKAADTIRKHLWGIINAILLRVTNGPSEGMNSRIKMIKVRARGFRNTQRFSNAIYFYLGGLNLYPWYSRTAPPAELHGAICVFRDYMKKVRFDSWRDDPAASTATSIWYSRAWSRGTITHGFGSYGTATV